MMRKNLFTAFVILFISVVCFYVYTDINTNNDIVNQEVLEVVDEPNQTDLVTNDIEEN